jgi:hypothetical protein
MGGNSSMSATLNGHLNDLDLDKASVTLPTEANRDNLSAASDHLKMTKEKLDEAVVASKRILQEAACSKLPSYV